MHFTFKRFINFITTSNTFIAFTVLLVGLSATMVSWQEARESVNTKIHDTLVQSIDETEEALQKRIAVYEELIRGGGGLFAIRGQVVSRNAFTRYAADLNIKERFPGLLGLGFAPVITDQTKAAHETVVKNDGLNNYVIFPAGTRDTYTPVMYIEPLDEHNIQALGFDMYSDPIRKSALDIARDTGKPAITDTVTLVQNSETDTQIGFLYYLPVYSKTSPTTEERRTNIIGYVFAPVRLGDLMQGIFDQETLPAVSMQVFDNNSTEQSHLVFESSPKTGDTLASKSILLGDHTWKLQASSSAKILDAQERQQPFMIFILGAGASLILAAFIFIVMRSRARELAYQKQLDIQQVKDDLLSLASHQLRTPATGVKQYLGIVLEGYTGDVSKEQRQMLQKANASNERQLEIVNQLLHVTRLETGRLTLRRADFNLTALMDDIINEQQETISSRNQNLTFKKVTEAIRIYGDEQYLRMAIENLISNASKYTYNGGDIDVNVTKGPDRISISISDTGVGIAPEDYDKLFQKFSRIDNELSVQAGGSGIGLYLTKEIVELHGGTISVDSERESGSAFTIILPTEQKQ